MMIFVDSEELSLFCMFQMPYLAQNLFFKITQINLTYKNMFKFSHIFLKLLYFNAIILYGFITYKYFIKTATPSKFDLA